MSESKYLIETVKDVIKKLVAIEDENDVHIDFIDPQNGDIGLFPVGPTLVKKDILGNPTYKMVFTMYSQKVAFEDFNRINNVQFFSNLSYKLNRLRGIDICEPLKNYLFFGADTYFNNYTFLFGEEIINGKIIEFDAGNGMKYSIPTGDSNDGVIYQLQITVQYKLDMSDFF